MPTPLVLFDDDSPWLSPLNDLRASFLVRTGALTTLERWRALAPGVGMTLVGVRPSERLRALTLENEGVKAAAADGGADAGVGEVVFVNGRCVMPPAVLAGLGVGTALVASGPGSDGETVVATKLSGAEAWALLSSLALPASVRRVACEDARVLHRPWDVIRHRDACLDEDLKLLAPLVDPSPERELGATPAAQHDFDPRTGQSRGTAGQHRGTCVNEAHVHIHLSAKISPGVILDAEGGPIVIDENAVIRPGVIIVGPAYIGRGSTILERALIKAHTAIGPMCKVAGEVGGTIFQGYANKGHDGHLGDSWVGEWANFGAGTTNSNLLNTYAEVIATALAPGASRERTGIQYLGCIVGDHTKFAILTRIMTGSVFGTGCMVATAAAPPTCVPALSWLTDERTQPYRFSKFLEVAKTVMARRKVVPSEAYVEAVKGLA
ncbi:MAG: putative sugar nucleotidyl transferase [Phycisphaerales bacterium]